MIAAPSNAAVDTILEKLVLVIPSVQQPTVVRLGRVGGDTHGKERINRMYLQKYELDGMVDRRIEMYRSDQSKRLATETDGFLRKKFEQDILMNARVVVVIASFSLDCIYTGHFVECASDIVFDKGNTASYSNYRRSHAVYRTSVYHSTLREAFTSHSRWRFSSTCSHDSESHDRSDGLWKVTFWAMGAQWVRGTVIASTVSNDSRYLFLAKPICVQWRTDQQQTSERAGIPVSLWQFIDPLLCIHQSRYCECSHDR